MTETDEVNVARVAAERVTAERVLAIRSLLVGLGLLLLLIGGIVFLRDINPQTYVGVGTWLAGAIVLHDGVVALAVFGVAALVRRADGIPFAVRAIVQGAAAIGALVALLVTPEIVKQAIGAANPTVLPLDYLGNLLRFEAALVAVTVVAIVVTLAVRRVSTRRTAGRTQ